MIKTIEKYETICFIIIGLIIISTISGLVYLSETETNKQDLVKCIVPRSEVTTFWKKECPKITDDTDDTENNEVK